MKRFIKRLPITGSKMKSKENDVLELFFNHPTNQWHFKDVEHKVQIAQSKLDKWLKKLVKEKFIVRVKNKGKRPYYMGNYESSEYQQKKRIFGLNKLYESGLLNYLSSLKEAKSIILFGSFSRSDWYKESDIDVFIYGTPNKIKIGKFERNLHRDIQIFTGSKKQDLIKMGPGLLRSIIKGVLIKGDIPIEVISHAGLPN